MRDFEADRRICDAATKGPWKIGKHGQCVVADSTVGTHCDKGTAEYYGGNLVCESTHAENAEFIAAARDGWADALKRIAGLETELAAAEHRANMLASMVDEYQSEIIPGYRNTAEKAIRERDAERAHNAELRQALKEAKNLWGLGIEYGYSQGCHLENKRVVSDGEELLNDICKALSATPSDSAAKVHKLVDALEKLARLGMGDRYGNSDGNIIAQKALAEWRNGK